VTVLLSSLTTLGLGGPARRVERVSDTVDLVSRLRECDLAGEPVLLLGGGSNVVVADEGFDGTVIQAVDGNYERSGSVITVEAGRPWDEVVAQAVDDGLCGIESLSGIPGSTGATPVQNVGAYGQEISDTLLSVQVLDRRTGVVSDLNAADCGFGYRTSVFRHRERFAVLEVTLQLQVSDGLSAPIRYAELARALGVTVGDRAGLADVRAAVLELRRAKSMVLDPDDPNRRSVGSFFTNVVLSPEAYAAACARAGVEIPSYDAAGGRKVPAAWLIEQAGFGKGYGTGPVGISSRHTLALVNRGGATTAELLTLAREIRDGVRDRFGVTLQPEPVFVGTAL
jgi:UDP-N-acetylmuramate dehydrogenase